MPTYDYVCEACGHTWEAFQRMSEDPLTTCPVCKAEKARRKIGGGAGIIFKGSGFYVTDYKQGAHKAKPAASGEGDKPAESKGESAGSDPAPAKSESAPSSTPAPAPSSDS